MQNMYEQKTIAVRCTKNTLWWIEAMIHPCGLAYHRDIETGEGYVVTHLFSGKLLIDSSVKESWQACFWIELLEDEYDWNYFDVDDALEPIIRNAWKQARKKKNDK